jgi:hypothetical protein
MASSHSSPAPGGVVLNVPSDYAEYDELRELMAEDRRRRALTTAGGVPVARPADFEHYRQRIVIGFDGVSTALAFATQEANRVWAIFDELSPFLPLSRSDRRARGRRISRADAYVRRMERQRTQHRRAQRPVIKKGLTR